MSLDQIGFYTMSDLRVHNASQASPLQRCELILGSRCNFSCPYCRRVGGPEMPTTEAIEVLDMWAADGLVAVRISGGEPTLHRDIVEIVRHATFAGMKWRALSTNGSAPLALYEQLVEAGVNDFSVSLDACCASVGDIMAGTCGAWRLVVENIRALARIAYVTAGIVLSEENASQAEDIVRFALDLGVNDVRVIPAAQSGAALPRLRFDGKGGPPILAYRMRNARAGVPVRGLCSQDSRHCWLALDDMVVAQHDIGSTVSGRNEWALAHYPCVIAMREGARPLGFLRFGKAGKRQVREERATFARFHDTHEDPICRANCLDVCRDYNNAYDKLVKKES